MSRAIQVFLTGLMHRSGSYVATSATSPVVQVAVHEKRVWRADIDGEAPASLRVSPEVRARAAAALEAGESLETLGAASVNAIDNAHRAAIVDVLVRAEELFCGIEPVWDYRPTSIPPRFRMLRGHLIADVLDDFTARYSQTEKRERAMPTALDVAITNASRTVPECVAVGYVDVTTGMLLGVKTNEQQPAEVLDHVAAATGDLFQGPNVATIEQLFRKARGEAETGEHYFQEIVVFSKNLIHVFLRGKKRPDNISVFVCRITANVGMVLSKTRSAMPMIEAAA